MQRLELLLDDRIPRLLNIISQIDQSLETSKPSGRDRQPKLHTARARVKLGPLGSSVEDRKWMQKDGAPKIKFVKQEFQPLHQQYLQTELAEKHQYLRILTKSHR